MNLNARVTRRWVAAVLPAAADPQRETAADGRLAFEAATIKVAAADAVRNRVMPTSPNRLYIPGMTLTALIYAAYGDGVVLPVQPVRQLGWQKWREPLGLQPRDVQRNGYVCRPLNLLPKVRPEVE